MIAALLRAADQLLRAGMVDALFAGALCAVALAISRLLRGRWPSLRQALWTLVLLRLVLPPGLSHPWSLGALLPVWSAANRWSEGGAAGQPTALSAGLSAAAEAHGISSPSWPGFVIAVWALLVVALAFVDLRGLLACRRLVRNAREVEGAGLARRLALWRRRLGIRRRVRVVAADERVSPFTVGILRPAIFVPAVLLQPGRLGALQSALAHELAHVARLDSFVLGLERVIGRLYFFHPAAWLAGRQLHDGREQLADRLVLSHGLMGKRAYARGLLDVLQLDLQGVGAPALHTTEGRVKMRILDILATKPDQRWQPRAAAVAAVSIGLFLVPLAPDVPARTNSADATALPALDTSRTAAVLHALANPLPGSRLTSGYGEARHPIKKTLHFHRGVDLAAPAGSEIHAAADGLVETATTRYKPTPDAGSVIVVDHGRGTKTFYAHLGTLAVRQGQQVRRGDVLAVVGMTGVSTGPHVHLEVWRDGEHAGPLERRRRPACLALSARRRRSSSGPRRRYRASNARRSVAMSIFCIVSIASMARFDLAGSGSLSIWPSTVGVTCHDRP